MRFSLVYGGAAAARSCDRLSQNGLVATSGAVGETDTDAARWWRAHQLAQADRVDDLRREAESGNEHAVVQLASRLDEHGRTAEAITVIRPLADSGHDVAQLWLARWLADDDGIRELRDRGARGEYHAVRALAEWLADRAAVDELRELVLAAESQTRRDLMSWLAASHDTDLLELASDLGDEHARARRAEILARMQERARGHPARAGDRDR
jgi:hypothetical protein